MSRYSHVFAGQEAGAVAALPDLSATAKYRTKAAGTDNASATQDAPGCPRINKQSCDGQLVPPEENILGVTAASPIPVDSEIIAADSIQDGEIVLGCCLQWQDVFLSTPLNSAELRDKGDETSLANNKAHKTEENLDSTGLLRRGRE